MENYNRFDERKENFKKTVSYKVFTVAVVIIGFGVVLLLRNMGLINDKQWDAIFSLPTLIIAIGIMNITGKTFWVGILMILFGGFFLMGDIFDLPIQIEKMFWPLLIILLGIVIIFSSMGKIKTKNFTVSTSNQNRIEEVSIFGGSERMINSDAFEGGEIVSIFGGSKIDFRRSKLAEGENQLDFVNIFGGTSIMVPPDWNIRTEVVSIFGGFADKRLNQSVDQSKTLVIKGVAIFGGGEIKS